MHAFEPAVNTGRPTGNLALKKPTWFSSTCPTSSSDYAVDGISSTNWYSNRCAGSDYNDYNPWWAVDLGQLTTVQKVTMLSRGDCCGSYYCAMG